MTVSKTLQEGEVRLRAGSHPGRRQLACLTRGAPGSVPGDAGAVAVPGGSQVSLQAEPQCQSFCYSRAKLRGLLLEGASLLLLRVLARRHTMPPNLVFPAMDTEGNLCTSSYLMQIGSPVLMVLQDESILSKSGTEQGRLVPLQHRQPLPTVWKPRGNTCPTFLLPGRFEPQLPFPKEPLDWEEDIQLYSWFLDRKDELQLSHAAYLQQHPEVRALLSDFLQALLFQQPHDPISFAAEFFAHQRPIGSPFASTGAASPVPSSPPANSK
uniref:Ciliogenesis-associated TTC17-interacting protein n=1 Tax=Corvus moneduloides TaxID=1196302 RepID=A0A8U7MUJ0_CORMO